MTSIVKQTPLLTSIGLDYSGTKYGPAFDKFLSELKSKKITEANVGSLRPELSNLFLSSVANLTKLTMANLRGNQLKKIITRNPDLKYLAVKDYFDIKTTDVKFLYKLFDLKVLVVTIDSFAESRRVETVN